MEAERVVPETIRQETPDRRERAAARRARRARRRRRTALVVVLIVVAAGATIFATRSSDDATVAPPTKGALLLNEEFNGTSLDSEHWSPCYWWASDGCTNLSNNELEWYVPRQVKVSKGIASLEAREEQVTGIDGRQFDYVSGLISNLSPEGNLFSFQYGYVEARVRVPEGQGLWPALWMLPTTREALPEVDIFEIVGERPDVTAMHTHWIEDGTERQRGQRWTGPNFADGWHTFGLDWKPDSLTWFVDGVARWQVTNDAQIPHEPMYLIANLAVGGDFTKSPNQDTELPAALQIDSIKVWAPGSTQATR